MSTVYFTINVNYVGVRLDKFLYNLLPTITNGLLSKLLRTKYIMLNYRKTAGNVILKEGDLVGIYGKVAAEFYNKNKIAVDGELTKKYHKLIKSLILYENDDLMVINKPAGLVVQGDAQGKSLKNFLKGYDGNREMRPVHRLDKGTSGVLLVAKNLQSCRKLSELFAERKIKKIYYAVTSRSPRRKAGIIESSLCDEVRNMKCAKDAKNVAEAITHYTVERRLNRYSLLKLTPLTGRKHQLRIHMASIGCPIIGDERYGGDKCRYMCLHAYSIKIPGVPIVVASMPDYINYIN